MPNSFTIGARPITSNKDSRWLTGDLYSWTCSPAGLGASNWQDWHVLTCVFLPVEPQTCCQSHLLPKHHHQRPLAKLCRPGRLPHWWVFWVPFFLSQWCCKMVLGSDALPSATETVGVWWCLRCVRLPDADKGWQIITVGRRMRCAEVPASCHGYHGCIQLHSHVTKRDGNSSKCCTCNLHTCCMLIDV